MDVMEVSRVRGPSEVRPRQGRTSRASRLLEPVGSLDDEHKGEHLFGPLIGGGLLFILGLL